MSYLVSTKQIHGEESFGGLYVKGNYYKNRKNLLFLKGDIYNYKTDELLHLISRKGVDIIPKLKGEFFIIYYDHNSKKIYIANDKLGRETLFYFHNRENLILSDDFWEIVNLIEPSASDIDIQSVKELAVFHHPLFYQTIIKNLNFLPPASVGQYSLSDHTLEIKQYWDFKYEPNKRLTLDEAANRLDDLFDKVMKYIKAKDSPKTVYGIGLSGGLDSRLVPYYALKHDMNLISFVIGEKRPHKFLLSRDHKSARELAKYYNLNHYEIPHDSESFENKSFYDVRYYPMGPSQFFITVRNTLPKFDILLTGTGGGELLGSCLSPDIDKLNKEELADVIIRVLSYVYTSKDKNFISKPLKFLRYVFKPNYLQDNFNRGRKIDGIITESEFIKAEFKIREFIENNRDKSNVNIFQKYLVWFQGSRNKYGSFDSLHGSKKSYGIFINPYIVEEALTWKPEFLINQRLQNHLCIKKFPELAKIPAQNYKVPILYRNDASNFKKALTLFIFILRGRSLRYTSWAWKKQYRKYSFEILQRKNKTFNDIFDLKKVVNLDKEEMRLYENLVKIKQILDLIETKDYKKFFE